MNRPFVINCVRLFVTALLFALSLSDGAADLPLQTDGVHPASAARRIPPLVILKVDDLRQQNGAVNERWLRLMKFARERKIKISIGVIANSLEENHPQYFQWIRDQQATGLVEFWNHGLDHREWTENGRKLQEFKGSSYELQKQHMARANQLAREKLGFPFQTFGAPFNATDDNTARVLAESPDIKVWLYGDRKAPGGKIVMDRIGAVNIENPIFSPSLEKFVEGYSRYPERPYFVIQGHPQQWDEAKFAQFVRIIDFLTKEKATFITPMECVRRMESVPAVVPRR